MFRMNKFLVCCSLQLFFSCKAIEGGRMKLPRYVIETDLKPAIFGSYSYDIVKGEFNINNDNSTTEINLTDIIFSSSSTSPTTKEDESYRKHVGVTTDTLKLNWWPQAREFIKNTTLYKYKINQNKTVNHIVKFNNPIKV